MDDLGLRAVPVGKFFDVLLILRVTDTTIFAGFQRIIDQVKPAQVFRSKIGVAPELDAFAEILDEIVVEFVLRYEGNQQQAGQPYTNQQLAALGDDEFRQFLHRHTGAGFSLHLFPG